MEEFHADGTLYRLEVRSLVHACGNERESDESISVWCSVLVSQADDRDQALRGPTVRRASSMDAVTDPRLGRASRAAALAGEHDDRDGDDGEGDFSLTLARVSFDQSALAAVRNRRRGVAEDGTRISTGSSSGDSGGAGNGGKGRGRPSSSDSAGGRPLAIARSSSLSRLRAMLRRDRPPRAESVAAVRHSADGRLQHGVPPLPPSSQQRRHVEHEDRGEVEEDKQEEEEEEESDPLYKLLQV